MLYRLQRHPFPVKAWFEHVLVLTYAYPPEVLAPLLPPGLTLDTHGGLGFLAVALVQTRRLRVAPLPGWLGQDFVLAGYRVFCRYRTCAGRTLRGLRILRSDSNRLKMVLGANLLTHYNYQHCQASITAQDQRLEVVVTTRGGTADLEATAQLPDGPHAPPAPLPADSPFADLHAARRFAGPLPYTFDYEKQTHSIIMIRGVRQTWNPQPVTVDVRRCTFLDTAPFNQVRPRLAAAFHLSGVPYRWECGVVERLEEGGEPCPPPAA